MREILVKKMTISVSATIREAMKGLNIAPIKCLLVVDEYNKLIGTLTDGDIRRVILDGKSFSETIEGYYCEEPHTLLENNYTIDDAVDLMRDLHFDLIPILNENGLLVDYITVNDVLGSSQEVGEVLEDVPVVIMAGGKGTRLEPFTKVLPKPLIPIHDKTIIEHIIDRFESIGCRQYYITVNYKSRILKAYFEELDPEYSVTFVDESVPLGTAGSLGMIEGVFKYPFFVTNCDILVDADYSKVYEFHINQKNDITLVACAKEYIIPYGTCELDSSGNLSHINEKPKYDFLINTGLYVLNPDVLEVIPEEKFYHITHLIEDVKKLGKKVGVYPIDEDAWIDIGQWVEFKKAIDVL
jgi:dTDP-glucose pyrophosphorylase/predicted transcriptional regulator